MSCTSPGTKTGGELIAATAKVGGGALPLLELSGPAVALPYHGNAVKLAAALRAADPPLLARISGGRVLVDPRTLPDNALTAASGVVRRVIGELTGGSPIAPEAHGPSAAIEVTSTPSGRS